MVAIVSSNTLGINLDPLSTSENGKRPVATPQGRNGERAYVNVANGDLVLQDRDALLVGLGSDISSLRTYNSQGSFDFDNNDAWQSAPYKSITRISSRELVRTDVDGSRRSYKSDGGDYYTAVKDDGGGLDQIFEDRYGKRYTWTDAASGVKEVYRTDSPGLILSSTDPSGNTLTYAYDSDNLLTSVTNADGESLNYSYTSGRRLAQLSTTLKSGKVLNQVSYGYDELNRLSVVSVDLNPGGDLPAGSTASTPYVTRYAYDGASTRVAGVTQSDGTSLAFTYAQVGSGWRIASITDGAGAITRISHDLAARATTITDAFGVAAMYRYDADGQLIGVTNGITAANPAGTGTVGYAWNAHGDLASVTDARGNKTTMFYSETGDLHMKTDSVGNVTFYTVDGVHLRQGQNVIDSTMSVHAVTRYVYEDGKRRLLRYTVSPEGRVTEFRYDAQGRRTSMLEYSDAVYNLKLTSDSTMLGVFTMQQWALQQWHSRVLRTDYTYDHRGQLQSSTVYGAVDRYSAGVAATGMTTRYVYDHRGLLLQTIGPDGKSSSQTIYDGLGRAVLSITGTADGTQAIRTAIRYDDASRASTVTLANGLQTSSVFDAAGRLASQTNYAPNGEILGATRNVYDADGRLLMSEDASGKRNWMLYDAAGRKRADIDGAGGLTEYLYNANDQVIETIRYATAVDVRRLVDANGNPLTAYNANPFAAPNGTSVVTLDAIRPARAAQDARSWNAYDALGRLSWQIDALGYVIRNVYDVASRLNGVIRIATPVDTGMLQDGVEFFIPFGRETAPVGAVSLRATASADDRSSYFFYDRDGLLVQSIDEEGYTTEIRYDAAGRQVARIAHASRVPGYGTVDFNYRLAMVLRADFPRALMPNATDDDIGDYRYYNNAGQLVAEVEAGYLTETLYDANGKVARTIRYANPPRAWVSVIATLAELRPVASPQDRVTSYTWDAFGRLASQTNPEGTITRYSYDAVGNLIGTVTAADTSEQRGLLASYDLQGRLVAELSAEGAALLSGAQSAEEIDAIWASHAMRYAYDAAGTRISATDASGNRSVYLYDDAARLRFAINGAGEITENRYDAFGRKLREVRYAARLAPDDAAALRGGLLSASGNRDAAKVLAAAEQANVADNRVTQYAYDADGRLVTSTDATGATSSHAYNAFGEQIRSILQLAPDTQTTTLRRYDKRGLLLAEVADAGGLSLSTGSEYDAFGRVVRTVDGNGNVHVFTYDTRGRVVQSTDPSGAIRLSTYDAFDRVLTQTDALGHVTSYRYDDAARSIIVTTPDGVSVATRRNRFGQTDSITDGRGNTTRFYYDHDGRLLSTETPATRESTSYDDGGHLVASVDANGTRTVYRYDAANRLLSRTVDPDGLALTTIYRYDAFGDQIAVTAPDGVVTLTTYDADGRVLSQTVDPASPTNPGGLNLVTRYAWDARGDLLSVMTPGGSLTRYVYDGAGRRLQTIVDPYGLHLVTSHRYDANGNVIATTDPDGRISRQVYDASNRLIYSIDAAGNVSAYRYDAAGKTTAVLRYAQPIDTAGLGANPAPADIEALLRPAPDGDAIENRVYDDAGHLVATVDGVGAVVAYRYDANGNVSERIAYANPIDVRTWTPGTMPAPSADPAHDQLTRTVYDALNRAVYQLTSTGDGSQIAVSARRFDGNGNLIERIDYAHAISANTPPSEQAIAAALAPLADARVDVARRYLYDAAGRMSWSAAGTGAVTRYVYDAHGRLVKKIAFAQRIAADAPPPSVTPGAGDRITQFAYDGAGRLVYSVDALGAVTQTVYDGNGNATKRIAYAHPIERPSAATAPLTAASLTAMLVSDPSEDRVSHAFYDGANRQALAIDASGAVTYTAFDGNGNAIAVIAFASVIDVHALRSVPTIAEVATLLRPQPNMDRITLHAYDAASREIYSVDALGYVTQHGYDALGRLQFTTLYATPARNLPAGSNAAAIAAALSSDADADRTTRQSFDAAGRLLQRTDALGHVESWRYNALGAKLSWTNANGATWDYDYDAAGRQVRELSPEVEVGAIVNLGDSNPDGSPSLGDLIGRFIGGVRLLEPQASTIRIETRYTYDALGNLIERTEAAGSAEARSTRYEYDASGRQIRTTLPPVGVYDESDLTHLAQDGGGSAARAETMRAPATQVGYNSFGEAVASIDAAGNMSVKAYDAAGRIAFEVDAAGYVTAYGRNAYGDVIAMTRHARQTRLNASVADIPDAATIAAAVGSDEGDRTIRTAYDCLGRAVQTTQPAVWVNNGQGGGYLAAPTTRIAYDAFGQVVQSAILADASQGMDGASWAITDNFYNRRGEQIASIDALGYLSTQAFDAAGNLLQRIEYAQALPGWDGNAPTDFSAIAAPQPDRKDRITSYAYDLGNRRISEVQQGGEFSTLWPWTLFGTQPIVTSQEGDLLTTYAYDALGNLVASTDALGKRSYNYYDALGRVKAVALPAGAGKTALTRYLRDAFGNVVVQIEASNGADAADIAGYRYTADLGNDRVTMARYDSRGNAIEIIDAGGVSHYASFDALGRLAKSWQGVRGRVATHVLYTVHRYDALGRQTEVITPQSNTRLNGDKIEERADRELSSVLTAMRYNAFGEMVARGSADIGSAALFQEFFDYDGAGRLWRSNGNDGVVKIWLYDLQGRQSAQIVSAGSAYGGLGIDLQSIASAQEADWRGSDGLRRSDTVRDLLGRAVLQIQPLRQDVLNGDAYRPAIFQSFDRWGNVLSQSDARNSAWRTLYEYDQGNRLIAQVQPDAYGAIGGGSPRTEFFYDALGRQLAVRDANDYVNGQVWDDGGRLVLEMHADGGRVRHQYDIFGNRVTDIDAMGNVTRYGYDRLGHLTQITHVGVDVYGVDERYRVSGRRTDVSTWQYWDDAGRMVAEVDGEGGITQYRYDLRGNVIATTVAGVVTATAAFDTQGHKIAQRDANGRLSTWDYDTYGRLLSRTDLGGVATWYRYDHAGQLIQQDSGRGQRLRYRYDAAGQQVQIIDDALQQVTDRAYDAGGRTVWERTQQAGVSYQDQRMQYDTLGRLARVDAQSGVAMAIDYDGVGNKRHVHVDYAGRSREMWYAYDAMNRQILADGAVDSNPENQANITAEQGHLLAYDRNGNRIRDIGWDTAVVPLYRQTSDETGTPVGPYLPSGYEGVKDAVTHWYAYDAMNRLSQVLVGAIAVEQTGTTTVWSGSSDSGGPVATEVPIMTRRQLDRDQAIVLDTRLYDGASRLVQSGPAGALSEWYVRALAGDNASLPGAVTTVTRYDSAGRVLSQHTRNEANGSDSETVYRRYTTTYEVVELSSEINEQGQQETVLLQIPHTTWEDGYDAAGNVLGYRTTQGDIVSDTTIALALYDGYKEASVSMVMTNTDSGDQTSGTMVDRYDVNGYLIGVADANPPPQEIPRPKKGIWLDVARSLLLNPHNRSLINDAYGHVLQKKQEDNVQQQLFVNGKLEAVYGRGTDPDNQTKPGDNGKAASPNYITLSNFDPAYRPVTNNYPSAGVGQYVVQAGDTLQGIAQNAYGDSGLWYLIAQANGLASDAELRVGQTLSIPSRVTAGVHNNAQTFAPYDAARTVGSTAPNLPTPQGDDGCSLEQVLVIAVSVVATIWTAGATAELLAGETVGEFGAMMELGGSVLLGNAGVAGAAAVGVSGLVGVEAAVIGGAVGSLAGQVFGNIIGVQDGISLRGVALGALSAGVATGVGMLAQGVPILGATGPGAAGWLGAASRAMVANAVTQGIGVAVGLQPSFSWTSVAAAAAGAGLSAAVGEGMNTLLEYVPKQGFDLGKSLISGTVSGFVGGMAASALRGGRLSVAQVARDAFGNALGNSLVEASLPAPVYGKTFEEDRQAREAMNPLLKAMRVSGNDAGRMLTEQVWQASMPGIPALNDGRVGIRQASETGTRIQSYWDTHPMLYASNDVVDPLNSRTIFDNGASPSKRIGEQTFEFVDFIDASSKELGIPEVKYPDGTWTVPQDFQMPSNDFSLPEILNSDGSWSLPRGANNIGNPFLVKNGQITFEAEGNEIQTSPYFSRVIQWPGGNSGVTLGRGYDMKERTESGVKSDLFNAGIDKEMAIKFAQGAGLSGQAAKDFVATNKRLLGEISPTQQKALFEIAYSQKEQYAEGFYGRVTKSMTDAPSWSELNPIIRDVAVDFAYQGTSTSEFRAIATNSKEKIISFIKESEKLMKYEANRGRIKYLEAGQ